MILRANIRVKDFNKFPNNIEILCPKELDVFAQLDDLNNFLKIKINKKYHSKEEILRDINITKIITQYIQFIKKKILLLKNYLVFILSFLSNIIINSI